MLVLKFLQPSLISPYAVPPAVEGIVDQHFPHVANGPNRLIGQFTQIAEHDVALPVRALPPELVFEEKIVVAIDAHLLEHEVFKFSDAVAGIVDRLRLGENLFRIDA